MALFRVLLALKGSGSNLMPARARFVTRLKLPFMLKGWQPESSPGSVLHNRQPRIIPPCGANLGRSVAWSHTIEKMVGSLVPGIAALTAPREVAIGLFKT